MTSIHDNCFRCKNKFVSDNWVACHGQMLCPDCYMAVKQMANERCVSITDYNPWIDATSVISDFLKMNWDKGFSAREIGNRTQINDYDVDNAIVSLERHDVIERYTKGSDKELRVLYKYAKKLTESQKKLAGIGVDTNTIAKNI